MPNTSTAPRKNNYAALERGETLRVRKVEKREREGVRLQQATLDERGSDIVAHGWLDITAINNLRVGDYQREIIENRGGKRSPLREAVETDKRLPDIMLGMRGEKYSTSKSGDYFLEDDVYIIDGLQRVSALRKFAADHPEEVAKVRIGAEVRFDTTRDSENELFIILNVKRKAMAPSVILRNTKNENEGVATLFGLSNNDKNFAMWSKVCWDQQMRRGELMTGLNIAKTAVTLHRHAAQGTRQTTGRNIDEIVLRVAKATGLQNFRANLITFFDAMDEVWGIRGIRHQDRVTHLRANFIMQLAAVFSDHEEFWEGNRLVVGNDVRKKLKSFPITDPTIIRLAGGGNMVAELLRRHIIDHLNRNKQASRHLTLRRIDPYHGKVAAKRSA